MNRRTFLGLVPAISWIATVPKPAAIPAPPALQWPITVGRRLRVFQVIGPDGKMRWLDFLVTSVVVHLENDLALDQPGQLTRGRGLRWQVAGIDGKASDLPDVVHRTFTLDMDARQMKFLDDGTVIWAPWGFFPEREAVPQRGLVRDRAGNLTWVPWDPRG